ncbi:MAG: hypothetical protein HYT62_00240 [Candidatus Yanofskybacteria bacterium]|nr:hypothetical protein [Candidatus Yanofskybacteria bacterium]
MSILSKIRHVDSYLYRNLIAPRLYSWRDRKILEKNLELKNKYAGKRCFIIGGGPSVSNIDLGILSNEYTFVMAEFDKNLEYLKLMPKFHIIADSAYFSEDQTEYWPERLRAKSGFIPTQTIMYINIGAKSFIDKYGLFKNHRVYFIGMQGIFTENLPFNIGLTKYVPYPKNSVLMCLMVAHWMGFEEIYLLGCEHNFLSFNIGRGKSLVYSHSYQDELSKLDPSNDAVLKKYISPRDLKLTYEKNIAHVLQLFKNYRFFYKRAREENPKIRILNATPDSFLDVFPMVNFEDIKFDGK